MAHWTFTPHGERFCYRFKSKELAERFACYWPGCLGHPVAVTEDPFNPPVWYVQPNRFGADIALSVENRTIPVRFL